MRPAQKVLTTILWGLTVLAMVSVIGAGLWNRREAGGEAEDPLAVVAEVPAFELIDQNNQPVSRESLRGTPWVANFVFTRCAGPCPVMTAKMGVLQKALPADVKLISVSVDPTHDTPEVLKEYSAKYDADDSRWHFLTGNADAVHTFARGMLITAMPATADKPIIHSDKFLIVDREGNIRRYYSSADDKEMADLQIDAQTLSLEAQP